MTLDEQIACAERLAGTCRTGSDEFRGLQSIIRTLRWLERNREAVHMRVETLEEINSDPAVAALRLASPGATAAQVSAAAPSTHDRDGVVVGIGDFVSIDCDDCLEAGRVTGISEDGKRMMIEGDGGALVYISREYVSLVAGPEDMAAALGGGA